MLYTQQSSSWQRQLSQISLIFPSLFSLSITWFFPRQKGESSLFNLTWLDLRVCNFGCFKKQEFPRSHSPLSFHASQFEISTYSTYHCFCFSNVLFPFVRSIFSVPSSLWAKKCSSCSGLKSLLEIKR